MKNTKTDLDSKFFLSPPQRLFIIIIFTFCFILFLISLCGLCLTVTYTSNVVLRNKERVAGESTQRVVSTYKVIEVVDGDTIKINYNGSIEKVRLIGIDTPETRHPTKAVQCFGNEATNKMKELVLDREVKIDFDRTQGERDKYGRLLLYIWQEDTFINDLMIRKGYAYEYTYNLPYKYQKQFKQAEKEAREARKGLWGDVCN